jgi:sRNA-binding carbon storage regulator CsrA
MLVIGRRPGEGLTVLHKGEVLKLSVWLEDHHIKVGLDAPRSFAVLRNELSKAQREELSGDHGELLSAAGAAPEGDRMGV